MVNIKKPEVRNIVLPAAIIIIAAVCIFIGGYLARGWIRESFIPKGPPSHFARRSLHRSYQQSLNSLSQPADELKIKLDENVHTDCDLSAARFFQTRVSCDNGSGDGTAISDDYITWFKQNSADIEQKILQDGWTKTWNAAQPINELFDNPDNDVGIGVNYEKEYGKNTCTLSLFYIAYKKNPSELRYSLSCYRYINYLGNPGI